MSVLTSAPVERPAGTSDDPDGRVRIVVPDDDDFLTRAYLDTGGDPKADDAPHDDFIPAPDVARLARLLIAKHRTLFTHLDDVVVDYAWKRRGGSSGGKATLGTCVKQSGWAKYKTGCTWLIWLAADHCRSTMTTAFACEALVFHELLHAGADEDGKPTVIQHDFEGFTREIVEYGLWTRDLVNAGRAVQQLQLPLFGDGQL